MSCIKVKNAPRKRISIKPFCKVCFDAGKDGYDTHFVRETPAPTSKVVCPTLLSMKCNYCKATGHTISHCPVLAKNKSINNHDDLKKHINENKAKFVDRDEQFAFDFIEKIQQEDDIHFMRAAYPDYECAMNPPGIYPMTYWVPLQYLQEQTQTPMIQQPEQGFPSRKRARFSG